MRIKILLMLIALTGMLFSISALAVPIEDCDEIPITPFSWTQPVSVDKFDQSKGQLEEVRITIESCGNLSYAVSNEDLTPQEYEITHRGQTVAVIPSLGQKIFPIETYGILDLAADEENENPDPDWKGPDYGLVGGPEILCSGEQQFILKASNGDNLTPYIGNENEELVILVSTKASTFVGGSGRYKGAADTRMGFKICVVYEYKPLACIFGSKVDCDDQPLSGWTITLTKPDGSTLTDVTDADGQYSFCALPAGSYKVCEETKPGWYPVGQTCHDVILDGDDRTVPAFKNTEHFCISGYKYNVTNNVEEPLADWTITLTKPDGSTVTDTTDANGYYEFCDLASGQYKVSEELKSLWIAKSPASVNVELYCEDKSVDFRNAKQPNLVCVCPFFIKNDLYGANILKVKEVAASAGILANDPAGSTVLNPESITIDPKYGTLTVEADGSFVYDPTVATGRLYSGQYVIFKYTANNGLCDSQYPGIAKIQLRK